MNKRQNWTLKLCENEALKYSSKIKWKENSLASYTYALRKKWTDLCCQHMSRPIVHNKKWTKENCLNDALNYRSKMEWFQASQSSYAAANIKGWLEECCAHMIRPEVYNKKWTKESVLKEANLYKTINEWKEKSSSSYTVAQNLGILNQCTKNLKRLSYCRTKKECIQDALKYTCIHDWYEHSPTICAYARKHKWMKACTAHMPMSSGISGAELILFNLIKQKFPKTQKLRDHKVKITNKPYIHGLDIDIYIPELRKGIEFDGIYYHSHNGLKRGRPNWPNSDLKNYHQIKDDYFKSKGIEILHIKEKDWLENKEECFKKCLEFLENKSNT